MALPALLLEALSDFEEQAAKPLSPGDQALTGTDQWMAAVEALRAATPELKERSDHLRQALAKLEQDADALGPRFDNLDETIDFLEQKEQEIKAVLDAEILGAKANRGQIFSAAGLSREQRALAIGVPQRYEAILLEILQTLRDTRWHLMTTRAEVEDPGDARVYDDPAALLESLTLGLGFKKGTGSLW